MSIIEKISEYRLISRHVMAPEIKYADYLSKSLQTINDRWPQEQQISRNDSQEPIFIFSAGWGSGSTLLQRLIISSNEVCMWGEPIGHSAIIPRLGMTLTSINRKWPPENVFDKDLSLADLTNKWIANLTPEIRYLKAAHRSMIIEWLGVPAKKFETSRWGLKEVRLTIDHARYLHWIFPKARFLFLFRNLFDCYQSCKGSRWYSVWPGYHCKSPFAFALHWKHLLKGYLAGYNELQGMLIRYEDLISEKVELEKISEYLKISAIDKSVLERKIGARAASRKKISLYDRFILRNVGGQLLKELGYQF